MADERIVIEIIQRFSSHNYRGAVTELQNVAKNIRSVASSQDDSTRTTTRYMRALGQTHPEIRKSANALANLHAQMRRNEGLTQRQIQNLGKHESALRKWAQGLSAAEREVLGLDRALEDLDTNTKKRVTSTIQHRTEVDKLGSTLHRVATGPVQRFKKEMREASDFTDRNTGAIRRFSRDFDRFTASTGWRQMSGNWRKMAVNVALAFPSALPQLLSMTGTALDAIAGSALQAGGALRSLAGGVGVLGAAITGGFQLVGALNLGLNNLGKSSQSFGKVFAASLSESGQDFYNMMKSLPPQAAKFAVTIRSQVFPVIHQWRQEMQGIIFPALQEGFGNLKPLLEPLHGAFGGMAKAVGDSIRQVTKELGNPDWQRFVNFQGGENIRNFRALSGAIVPLANAFRQLTTAAAPVTRYLADGAASAAKSFAHFINVRSETGRLGQSALRARSSFKLFFDLIHQVGSILGGILRVAQPFGVSMVKSLDGVAKSTAKWVNSFAGQNRIRRWFHDIQPTITATARLFSEFGKVILRTAENPGLSRFFNELRTKFLPALESVMTAVSKGATGTALVDLFVNLLTVLTNLTGPHSPAFIFIEMLNGMFKVMQAITSTPIGRFVAQMAFGLLAFVRIARLLGIIKVGRLISDWTGASDKISKSVSARDIKMQESATSTAGSIRQSTSTMSRAWQESAAAQERTIGGLIRTYRALQVEGAAVAESIGMFMRGGQTAAQASSASVAKRSAQIANAAAVPTMVMPPGLSGRPVIPAAAAHDAEVRAALAGSGTANRGQYRQFVQSFGVHNIEGTAVSRATTAQVKKAAQMLVEAEAQAFIAAASASVPKVAAAAEKLALAPVAAQQAAGRRGSRFYPGQALIGSGYDVAAGARMTVSEKLRGIRSGYQERGVRGALGSLRGGGGLTAGLTYGGPLALLTAGQFLPGRAGTVASGVGTGAMLGSFFGPEGAIVGGLAGAVLSLGLFKKGVDATTKALRGIRDAGAQLRQARAARPQAVEQLQLARIDVRDARRGRNAARQARTDYVSSIRQLDPSISTATIRGTQRYKDLTDQLTRSQVQLNDAIRNRTRAFVNVQGVDKAITGAHEKASKRLDELVKKFRNTRPGLGKTSKDIAQDFEQALRPLAREFGKQGFDDLARRSKAMQHLADVTKAIPKKPKVDLYIQTHGRDLDIRMVELFRYIGQNAKSRNLRIDIYHHATRSEPAPSRFDKTGGGRFRAGGVFVPGQRVAADSQPALLSPGELVVTDDGQRIMEQERPGLIRRIVSSQRPHFNAGGIVRRFAAGGDVPPPVPGASDSALSGAVSAGAGATSKGAFWEYLQGLLGAFTVSESSTGGLDLSGVPKARRPAIQRMIQMANRINRAGGPRIQENTILSKHPGPYGQLVGIGGPDAKPVKGYTLASAITGILKYGGFNVPLMMKTRGLAGIAPLKGKGSWITLLTQPRPGAAANGALQILHRAFGSQSRSNDVIGSEAGLGWLSGVPSDWDKKHWHGFRRGGMVGGKKPLFTREGPAFYARAFRHNRPFARPGPYQTHLDRKDEQKFRAWVRQHRVPFNANARISDYDMRGYWMSTGGRPWSGGHFPDRWKTPYDTSFSHESRYASAGNPFFWRGDALWDRRNDQLVFRGGGQVPRFGLGGFLRRAPGAIFSPVKALGKKVWKGNLKQIQYEKHRDLTYAYQDRGLGWKQANWLADIMLGPHPLRKQSMVGRGHRRGGLIGRVQRFAGGGIVGQVNQPGVAGQFGMIQMGQMLQRASFGFILTLIHEFQAIIALVQMKLASALKAGHTKLAEKLNEQLDRLTAGLQAVGFAAGQRIGRVTDRVTEMMDRVGRIDQTSLAGIGRSIRATQRAMKLMVHAIQMAVAAGSDPEFIKQLKDQLQALRDARRDQKRSVYATRVSIANFREQRQQIGLQKLELQQRLAGTFDTGGAERASFITSKIIPGLQKELKEMQIQLKKGGLTAEEKRQQQLAIDQKRNEILQAQLDAQEAIKANTAAVAQKLTGNLSFEFGGQTQTDLIGAGTGV